MKRKPKTIEEWNAVAVKIKAKDRKVKIGKKARSGLANKLLTSPCRSSALRW